MKRYNPYADQMIDGQMCVWLQSHGWQPAKPAAELMVGDFIMYNFGHVSKVIEIKRESASFIFFDVLAPDVWGDWSKPTVYDCRMKKTRLAPIASLQQVRHGTKNSDLVLLEKAA